VEIE